MGCLPRFRGFGAVTEQSQGKYKFSFGDSDHETSTSIMYCFVWGEDSEQELHIPCERILIGYQGLKLPSAATNSSQPLLRHS